MARTQASSCRSLRWSWAVLSNIPKFFDALSCRIVLASLYGYDYRLGPTRSNVEIPARGCQNSCVRCTLRANSHDGQGSQSMLDFLAWRHFALYAWSLSDAASTTYWDDPYISALINTSAPRALAKISLFAVADLMTLNQAMCCLFKFSQPKFDQNEALIVRHFSNQSCLNHF